MPGQTLGSGCGGTQLLVRLYEKPAGVRPGRDAELRADTHRHCAPGLGQVPHAGGSRNYKGILSGFGVTLGDGGLHGLARGWTPTSSATPCRALASLALCEVFIIRYAELLGQEKVYRWRNSLYLTAWASAESFAHRAPASMEAVKVRVQTQPGYGRTLRAAAPRTGDEEGLWAFAWRRSG